MAVLSYPFAVLFGKCLWTPPSGKAAVIAILWLFGQVDPDEGREAVTQQYVATGNYDAAEAKTAVENLEACFVIPEIEGRDASR